MTRAPIRTQTRLGGPRDARVKTALSRGTRTQSSLRGAQPLEALAAEFALLAQRRGRVARQLALLDRQRDAAGHTLAQVEHRLAVLARRMGRDEALAFAPAEAPAPPPPPPPPPPAPPRAMAGRHLPPPPAPPAPAPRPPRYRRGMLLEY